MDVARMTMGVLDKIKKDGFLGFQIDYIERYGVWHHEYSNFVLEFDVIYCNMDVMFKFENKIRKVFSGCDIKFYPRLFEFEIIGPNYRLFTHKHLDDLESCSSISLNKGFLIYELQRVERKK